MIHYTHRGAPIDMEMMRVKNGDDVALGNAHLNARGDLIGSGGVVIKSRAELLKEQERQHALPDVDPMAFEQTFDPTPNLDDQFAADPAPQPTAPKRAPRRSTATPEAGE